MISDADLLTRFVAHRDVCAFEQIVSRYGPMVMGTARRLLEHEQDAEDAFQAVFLALAHGAAAIRHKEALAAWLHCAAERTACAVVKNNMKWARSVRAVEKPTSHLMSSDDTNELIETLHLELRRLPLRYHTVIVLCDIEGLSRKDAAARLGVPVQTVTTQLARGRNLLKCRLTRIGVTASLGAAIPHFARAASNVNSALVAQASCNAIQLVAGRSASEMGISPTILQLAKVATGGMALSRFSSIGVVALSLLLSVVAFAGVGGQLAKFAMAPTIAFYDFGHGADDGWTHIDNTAGRWAPGIFDASSGRYVLATSDIVAASPLGITDTLFAIMDASSDPRFSNGLFRAKVRAETEATRFMLIFRQNGANGYAFSGGPSATDFAISRVDNAATILLERIGSPLPAIAVGEAWLIEASAVDRQLSMKFWREGDPEPVAPQLRTIDSTYSQGSVAIGIRKDAASRAAGQLRATFDDIVFRAQEPRTSFGETSANCKPEHVRRGSAR